MLAGMFCGVLLTIAFALEFTLKGQGVILFDFLFSLPLVLLVGSVFGIAIGAFWGMWYCVLAIIDKHTNKTVEEI